MKRVAALFVLMVTFVLVASIAHAGQIRTYVAPFTVTGMQNKDELRGTLQSLLASRLSSDILIVLDSPAGADVTVVGSYIIFGKVFSIDAVAKDAAGSVVARAFVQGESQDQLIPSIGKLAKELAGAIEKRIVSGAAPVPAPRSGGVAAPVPAVKRPESREIDRSEPVVPSSPDVVRTAPDKAATPGSLSQRLSGSLVGLAPGTLRQNGAREWYVINDHALRLYLQEDKYKLLAEISYRPNEYLLGIDTADLDGDGVPEAYVTVMKGESLSSEVWIFQNGALRRIADGLPYFFRGLSLAGGSRKIYVQQMGLNATSPNTSTGYGRTSSDFYDDVYELVKSGDKYERKNPIKLPDQAFLYNFNMFRGEDGQDYFVVLNDDGYLIVYSMSGDELWRSTDKYGGSALSFKREDAIFARVTGSPYRSVFLQQRIFTTRDGDVIVPQNSGTFVFGTQRSYKKSAVYGFAWNGASLEEKWHTKPIQNYVADYYYDSANKELVLLEVVKKEGAFTEGASMISVKRVE
ncbi:VCBS repeat-containing protein [Geobacter sp.]|uniref:FG-GAP repeat domain-containing protein n=1 Tax=Geobacter sp. TaxID=46610 RepID=UPI00262BA3B1|nr:VCBS repeat-containing protein [Geobacter sp.]